MLTHLIRRHCLSPRLFSTTFTAARAVSMFAACRQPAMVSKDKALPGRDEEMKISDKHFVLGNPMKPPFPDNMEQVVVATGCFWGTERLFYKRLPGVYTTAVGYINGFTKNPTYKEVCTGRTGHTEAVLVVFDPAKASFADLLKIFWESHNPTHGFRQGPDVGTQYRSGIYCTTDKQMRLAEASKKAYQAKLDGKAITTEIVACPTFYYAEDYHQQYLDKPGNRQYCGAAPTGEALPPPLEWDLSDEDKASTSTNPDVWSKVWAGCVFGE
ncbi:methionine-S-sulfoxide reductase [Salpingoeca rosetta]|uniref:peptide-methionine (S)-S-oxide reductase n=1 Tax=Salpingoeca rosetta (strain ATCC 50818 / BSB-021) TaxID=946362 RepID=F2UJV2_SALR5|nr:methionine-S-sulfoxide reductase [Salpingoeca rosetta]EGD77401.1 methionine-S-sulfoxide reductase [Salpingoeca rosetta]|eukprot:XP_004990745.1 methionine-S-sulfoxide reductase [Salpingoeca rosetta]